MGGYPAEAKLGTTGVSSYKPLVPEEYPHSGWILRIKSKIRISEIHDLSGFLGKDLTDVFLTGGFSRKEKRYETDVYRSRK